ncbi:MAG: flagellar biosynthesis protein FlhF [Rhizobacter sp.]|nr:flagellar biosynthesis protein FlhF [Rhizobacter sp.]
MNVQRFTARTSREALAQVRQVFGADAVVLSTKPCPQGIEVLAMGADGIEHVERISATAPHAVTRPIAAAAPAPAAAPAAPAPSAVSQAVTGVAEDVARLAMSTLSFQDYVRERMLKRRQAVISSSERGVEPVLDDEQRAAAPRHHPSPSAPAPMSARRYDEAPAHAAPSAATAPTALEARMAQRNAQRAALTAAAARLAEAAPAPSHAPVVQEAIESPQVRAHDFRAPAQRAAELRAAESRAAEMRATEVRAAEARATRPLDVPTLADEHHRHAAAASASASARRDQADMMNELRSMKGLIEERFGALAFMEKLQRQPAQARLTQRLLDCGFSPALIRKLAESMGASTGDEIAWAANVLERNLLTCESDAALEDQGGIFALVGATGVGKTTTTAKIAAAFATRHGAANLGLITLDAYRVGAHEQLRAYGRILGVPVHTAHDRASLEDLLELLAGKKMVMIDTAGMAQRDSRTRELLDMLGHRSIKKLLVVNAAAQAETTEDVIVAYGGASCAGVVVSKMDEAVKLGPVLDAVIRHKLKVVGVANGQRVPEDWHRLSAHALVHRAMRAVASSAWRLDAGDMNLIFAGSHAAGAHAAGGRHASGDLHA